MPRVKREREEEPEQYASDYEEDVGMDDAEMDDDIAGPSGSGAGGRISFFAKGTIKQVKVHDFMTYNGTVLIKPGPRLNLVLGPNGTGKSSFVCALCIGLNGSPKTLGRADNLKDFVRRGQHMFWIEITLSSGGEGRDHVFRRTVTTRTERDADGTQHSRYDSKWAINGKDASAKEVDKLIKQMNIQFDNLCQFLPQDKVAEFARMDKYELLAATEKALGDSSLYDQHQRLIALRKEAKQAEADRGTSANRLAKLQADQERQRRDYERFQQREKLLQEARSFRCQAKWLEVYAKVKALEGAKKRWQEKKAELRALEDQQEEDIRPIKAKEELIQHLKAQKVATERQAREVDSRMRRVRGELDQHDQDVIALTDEMEALDQQSRKRAADIAEARQKVAAAEAQLAQAPERPPQELFDRLSDLRAKNQASRREVSEVVARQNNLASQHQGLQQEIGRVRGHLDELNSRRYQVLQSLGSKPMFRNIGQLHCWIEQHRSDGTFRGPVWGPVALELSVNAAPGIAQGTAVQYVENTCFQWLGSYIVTCQDDEKRLNQEARRMVVGTGVKVVADTGDPNAPFQMMYPAGPASQHARFGLVHTVDELVDAPPNIMRFLAKQCRVNTVYIGNNHAPASMTAIAHETPISTVLISTSRFTVLRSRYANNRSISEAPLYPPNLLGACGSSEEDAERAALAEELQKLTQEREQVHAEVEDLQRQQHRHEQQQLQWEAEGQAIHRQIQAVTQKRAVLASNVETAKRQLANKEAVLDPEQRRPLLRQSIEAKLVKHSQLCRQLVAEARAAWEAMKVVQVLEFRLREANAQLAALNDCRKQREEALMAARNAAQDAEAAFKEHKNEVARARDVATEKYPLEESDKEEIKRHEEAGTPTSALVAQAEAKEAEAEQVACNNQNVVTEYERRKTEIDQLSQTVQQHDNAVALLNQQITDTKDLWLPEIQKMVETINDSFSTNFKEIGYAGQVRLQEEEDFDKFAVEIMVQFRAYEDMQLLTGTRQSGGERSVSTILYLIALQGVTDTPFRVVDEINQGMDPINERKVFAQLVASSTEEHTPQCFLLTPKLLENLPYNRNVQVLTICAGGNIGEPVQKMYRTGQQGGGCNNGVGFFGGRVAPLLPA